MCYSRVEYGANIAPHRNKQLAWKNLAYLRDEHGSIQICKFIQLFLPKNLFSNISSLYVVCNIFQVNCVFTSLNTVQLKLLLKPVLRSGNYLISAQVPVLFHVLGSIPAPTPAAPAKKKTFIFKYLFVDI